MTRLVNASVLLLTCLLSTAALVIEPAPVAAAELRIGRAATVITPTEKTGGIKRMLDELHAKAVVLEKDDTLAAIVMLDLPVVNRPVVEGVRRLVAERTAIPAGNVMISVTHTHTGLTPGWAGDSLFPALFPPKRGKPVEEAQRYRDFLIQSTINHVDVAGPKRQKGPAEASRIGIVLAAKVLRTYRKLKPIDAGKLRATRENTRNSFEEEKNRC